MLAYGVQVTNPGRSSFVLDVIHSRGSTVCNTLRHARTKKLPCLTYQPSFTPSKRQCRRRSRSFIAHASQSQAAVEEGASDLTVDELKKQLIRAVANTERGKATTPGQRQRILELIERVESRNPTADPVKSPLVDGRWSLLYTAPVDEETADKYAGTEEGPFLSRVKPVAFGTVRQKGSSQIFDAANGVVNNVADFVILGTPGSLDIRGTYRESPPLPGRGAVRIDVTFESFTLRVGSLPPVVISLSWANPRGWVDTTYLDESFRIGRGDKGSVFVASRILQGSVPR